MVANLLAHLTQLESSELIHLAQRNPELEYIFHHELLQQVSYRSLLREDRKQLHLTVSTILEQLYGEHPETVYNLLAYHYQRAAVPDKALQYLLKAAEQAAGRYANEDAIVYYTEALDLLPETALDAHFDLLLAREKLYNLLGRRPAQWQDLENLAALAETMNDDDRRLTAALHCARYQEATGDYAPAIITTRQAVELAQANHRPAHAARGRLIWGQVAWRQGNLDEANEQLQQALQLARQTGRPDLEAESLHSLGVVAEIHSHYQAAGEYFEQAWRLYRQAQDLRGESRCLNSLGVLALKQSDFSRADDYISQALNLKRRLGDQFGESVTLNNLAIIAQTRHDYPLARRYFSQCRQLSQTINDREGACSAAGGLGAIALRLGDLPAARTYLEEALRLAQEIGDRFSESTDLKNLAWLAYALGSASAARSLAQQALRIGHELDSAELEQQILRLLGRILLHLGNLPEAADTFHQAVQLYRHLELARPSAEDLAGLAAVYQAQGDLAQALAQVEKVLAHLNLAAADFDGALLAGIEDPAQLVLDCYRVLWSAGDGRALAVLSAGYRWLVRQADTLEGGQPAFLEKVPAHAELIAAWYGVMRDV